MRIIGLDYGTKTVGVSISDETGLIAQPLLTIERKHADKLRQTYAQIESIIAEYGCEKIVLGLPKNMNNTESNMTKIVLDFKSKLENTLKIEVILEDERLTSKISNDVLIEGNMSRKKRKKVVDGVASVIILESYLDRRNYEK